MKQTKKCLFLFFAVLLIGLGCVAGLVIAVDPFFQYHKPLSGINYQIDNQMNQNPGIAKTFDYDAIILGSSMTDNFDTDLFENLTGEKTVKLSYNSAYPQDCSRILDIVRDYHAETKSVYWCVDIQKFTVDASTAAYELPEYLYDKNLFNDLAYLLNKDVMLYYILAPGENTEMKDAYIFWNSMTFSKEEALKNYTLPEEKAAVPTDAYYSNIDANLEASVIPYLESMSDTEFVFFFPPYSTLYWNTAFLEGELDAYLAGEQYLIKKLLQYENVRVFCFQDNYEIVTDLNRYCDYYHYDKDANDYMTRCMAEGAEEITEENLEDTLEAFGNYLKQILPMEIEK